MSDFGGKLDARSRQSLRLMPPDAEVEVLLQTEFEPTEQELAALKTAGLRIRAAVGPVLTGSIPRQCIEQVSELDCVLSLQVARDLFLEKK